jgi:hypothetical protein
LAPLFQERSVKHVILAGLALAAGLAAPAAAAQFSFDFATEQALFGPTTMGTGIFTTSDTATSVGGRDAFAITAISGMVNGSAIAAPTGNYGNYFTDAAGFLDGSGLRFFTEAGLDVRFFRQSSNGRYRVNTFGAFGSSNFVNANSAPVAGVPEPASWAMLIIGFGLTGAVARRRNPARIAT